MTATVTRASMRHIGLLRRRRMGSRVRPTWRALDRASSFSPKLQDANGGRTEKGADNERSEAGLQAPHTHLGKALDHQVHREQQTEYTDEAQVADAASSRGISSGVAHRCLQCSNGISTTRQCPPSPSRWDVKVEGEECSRGELTGVGWRDTV